MFIAEAREVVVRCGPTATEGLVRGTGNLGTATYGGAKKKK